MPFRSHQARTLNPLLRQSSTCCDHSARLLFSLTTLRPFDTIPLPCNSCTIESNRIQRTAIVHFGFVSIIARERLMSQYGGGFDGYETGLKISCCLKRNAALITRAAFSYFDNNDSAVRRAPNLKPLIKQSHSFRQLSSVHASFSLPKVSASLSFSARRSCSSSRSTSLASLSVSLSGFTSRS